MQVCVCVWGGVRKKEIGVALQQIVLTVAPLSPWMPEGP